MALQKRGRYWFGDNPSDLHGEITRYSVLNAYAAEHFNDCVCACSRHHFKIWLDDEEGVAIRSCIACNVKHPIGDCANFVAGATLEEAQCPCGSVSFELSVGLSADRGSNAVRWVYIGCRCEACGLVAVYGEWQNQAADYRVYLAAS